MTRQEREALGDVAELILKLVQADARSEAKNKLDLPPIGPEHGSVTIDEGLVGLPFTQGELDELAAKIENAIQTESRIAQGVNRATQVLVTLKGLVPILAGAL